MEKLKQPKKIALIAHDNMKESLCQWCAFNQGTLSRHELCGTGTTASLISKRTGMSVETFHSGPLGGDLQIGSRIVEGDIDIVIFFSDPLTAQPHDVDIKALLRIAQVQNIPIACDRASADFIISSPLLEEEYEHEPLILKTFDI
ncbi:MAG: methylglyoxal synthase [Clostridia bacterium]|nr:methylglyoxal synthase [Clostridia bacterium]